MSDIRDEFVLNACVLSQLCMDFFKPFFWLVKSFIVFDFDAPSIIVFIQFVNFNIVLLVAVIFVFLCWILMI